MERVADAMHWGLVHCAPDATLREVATLMADAVVHCVVVIEDAGDRAALWGVVSDLDLVAAAGVRDLDAQSAGGSAATPALAISPDDTLHRAAQMMTEHAAAHLLVVDEESRTPVGVLSTLDIARLLADRSRG